MIEAVKKDSSFMYKDGIVNSHEFSVLSAKKLSNGIRLVKCSISYKKRRVYWNMEWKFFTLDRNIKKSSWTSY